ncbi:MAG: hypothetical protein A2X05_14055 [Bacteroidetes bacterium GWE2_41_25]|nr:MAG: hypothetical protein A2X05_14055 [Bacteroidetes bacterium GWE2_41_25]HBH82312.1 hypothetical protein [Bacteroidales bacterium]
MKKKQISRREFLDRTAVTGVASIASIGLAGNYLSEAVSARLPREVWIAGLSQAYVYAETPEKMTQKVLEILKGLEPYKPDVVCLPEVFAHSHLTKRYTLTEQVETTMPVLEKFSDFSKQNNCYTICSVVMSRDKKAFNSAVVFDRNGNRAGVYDKIFLTEYEMDIGLTPGDLFQPVINTDFGKIGVQICFDILWDEGWTMYRKQGAEIIFFPSAFPGGIQVNGKAWQNHCVVASSTRNSLSKLCDITGEVIAQTGADWDTNLYCAPVNLEKAFLHSYPYRDRFNEVKSKYGRKVKIRNFHEENWSIIESLSPDVQIKDIMKEFDFKTFEDHKVSAENYSYLHSKCKGT